MFLVTLSAVLGLMQVYLWCVQLLRIFAGIDGSRRFGS
jgi:hypothetical protein